MTRKYLKKIKKIIDELFLNTVLYSCLNKQADLINSYLTVFIQK